MAQGSVFGAATHVGKVRSNNEDYHLLLKPKNKNEVLLIVADGMGGHNNGEEASDIAVNYSSFVIDQRFDENLSDDEILAVLNDAVEAANIQVNLEGRYSSDKKGMGTTLTVGLIMNNKLHVAHVGDSRIYLLRGDKFYQLTKDDTYVQLLVDKGEIEAEEASIHPQHNVLLKAIGSDEPVDPQLITYTLRKNDKLLFCTDGLYDCLSASEIKDILEKHKDVDECVDELIDKTLERGAHDNVTVVVGFI